MAAQSARQGCRAAEQGSEICRLDQVLQVREIKVTSVCVDTVCEADVGSFVAHSSYIKDLYALHWDELCGYLRSKFGGTSIDPEDIAQAVFTKFAGLEDCMVIKNPRGFLFTAARNRAYDEFRKEKIRLAHKDGERHAYKQDLNDELSPENVLSQRQNIRLLANVVEKLPKIQRTVLLLHRLEQLTYSQIANKMGLSETTIRRTVAKAVERIRKDLRRANDTRFYGV